MFDGTRISPRKGLRGRKAITSLRRGFVDEVLDLGLKEYAKEVQHCLKNINGVVRENSGGPGEDQLAPESSSISKPPVIIFGGCPPT